MHSYNHTFYIIINVGNFQHLKSTITRHSEKMDGWMNAHHPRQDAYSCAQKRKLNITNPNLMGPLQCQNGQRIQPYLNVLRYQRPINVGSFRYINTIRMDGSNNTSSAKPLIPLQRKKNTDRRPEFGRRERQVSGAYV